MSTYTAPLQDMQFVIKELVGLADITAMPDCAEVTEDLVDAVLDEAAKFATGVLDPLNRTGDKTGSRLADGSVTTPPGFKEAYRQFIAGGWNGLSGEAAYGGGPDARVSMPGRKCEQRNWRSAVPESLSVLER